MKRSLVLTSLLAVSLQAEDFAVYDGYIRAGYQKQDEGEFAVGGKLHLETNPINYMSFGASFYTTQGIDKKYNDGVSFFSSDKHSYSILGEAYLKAMVLNTDIKVGRQEIDTPYLDTDDIGMIPNTYEGVTLSNNSFVDTTIFASYVKKMAGVDADKPQKFNSIGNVYSVGLSYEGFEDVVLSSWYYDANDLAKIFYLESGVEKKFDNFQIDFDLQYTNQSFNDAGKVDVYGTNLAVTNSGITASVAYNIVDSSKNQRADNFFGGGPFFINCEHDTIAEIGVNGKGIRYGIDVDGGEFGLNGFVFGAGYLEASGDDADIEELDLVATFEVKDKLTFDFIYSDATDNLNDSNSFTNTRLFVNYKF